MLLDKVKNDNEEKLSAEEYKNSIDDIKTKVEDDLKEILYTASDVEKKSVDAIREFFNNPNPTEEEKDNIIKQIESIRT